MYASQDINNKINSKQHCNWLPLNLQRSRREIHRKNVNHKNIITKHVVLLHKSALLCGSVSSKNCNLSMTKMMICTSTFECVRVRMQTESFNCKFACDEVGQCLVTDIYAVGFVYANECVCCTCNIDLAIAFSTCLKFAIMEVFVVA